MQTGRIPWTGWLVVCAGLAAAICCGGSASDLRPGPDDAETDSTPTGSSSSGSASGSGTSSSGGASNSGGTSSSDGAASSSGASSSSGSTSSGSSNTSSGAAASSSSGSSSSGGSSSTSSGGGSTSSGGSDGGGDAGRESGVGQDAGLVKCGSATCPPGNYCCNALCGLCAPPGALCIQGCGGGINDATIIGCRAVSSFDRSCPSGGPTHFYACALTAPPPNCVILSIGNVTDTACCP